MNPPHTSPYRRTAAIISVAVFVSFAVVGAVNAHDRATPGLEITTVESGPVEWITPDKAGVAKLNVTLENPGRETITVGLWTYSTARHAYSYWPANTTSGRVTLKPGEHTTVTITAPVDSQAFNPGRHIAVAAMTPDGSQRTDAVYYLPEPTNETLPPTPTPANTTEAQA